MPAGTGVDLVTDLEVAHVGADLGDHAGHVVAEAMAYVERGRTKARKVVVTMDRQEP